MSDEEVRDDEQVSTEEETQPEPEVPVEEIAKYDGGPIPRS